VHTPVGPCELCCAVSIAELLLLQKTMTSRRYVVLHSSRSSARGPGPCQVFTARVLPKRVVALAPANDSETENTGVPQTEQVYCIFVVSRFSSEWEAIHDVGIQRSGIVGQMNFRNVRYAKQTRIPR
jgi:hypothetical protein